MILQKTPRMGQVWWWGREGKERAHLIGKSEVDVEESKQVSLSRHRHTWVRPRGKWTEHWRNDWGSKWRAGVSYPGARSAYHFCFGSPLWCFFLSGVRAGWCEACRNVTHPSARLLWQEFCPRNFAATNGSGKTEEEFIWEGPHLRDTCISIFHLPRHGCLERKFGETFLLL